MSQPLQEIERKFLVTSEAFKEKAFAEEKVVQAFLSRHPERTVRVRIKNDKGFLTIKGKSADGGLSRFEWEKEIPVGEAEALLELCEPGRIEKTRFLVKFENHTFEVDEFYGDNLGLILAEVELKSPEESFPRPDWLGEEVTGRKEYYNSYLSQFPYIGRNI